MTRLEVGIVGGGPRSLALLQHFSLLSFQQGGGINITIYDPVEYLGAGSVYCPAQSVCQRLNIDVTRFSVFNQDFSAKYPNEALSFRQWCHAHHFNFESVPSRALMGIYLHYAYRKVLEVVPSLIRVRHVKQAVRSIHYSNREYIINTESDVFKHRCVAIVTGHENWHRPLHKPTNMIPVFPTKNNLSTHYIPARAKVIIKGMGLSAFDAILELTEGRGGKFSVDEASSLCYTESGGEPDGIYLSSRSRRLILPKPIFNDLEESKIRLIIKDKIPELKIILASRPVGRIPRFEKLMTLFFNTSDDVAQMLSNDKLNTQYWLEHRWPAYGFEETQEVNIALCGGDYDTADATIAAALATTFKYFQPIINDTANFGGFSESERLAYKKLARVLEPIAYGAIAPIARKVLCLIKQGLVHHIDGIKLPESDTAIATCELLPHIEWRQVNAFIPQGGYEQSGSILSSLYNEGIVSVDEATGAIRTSAQGHAIRVDGREVVSLGIFGRVTEHWVTGNDSLNGVHAPHLACWVNNVVCDTLRFSDQKFNSSSKLRDQSLAMNNQGVANE